MKQLLILITLANTDNQTCIPIVIGCTNDNYLEYDGGVNTSDESYYYQSNCPWLSG